ncbi:MAG: hypothetical protein Q8O67_11290 [Deltaproteobacteria bacterium]|nr:hypothetical protein [Deltaproteobacteria bacterium]
MFPFRKLFVSGLESKPRAGDRVIYDERNGTLYVHREEGDVLFQPVDGPELSSRLFIGRGWTRDLTKASAELYGRLGGLSGRVTAVDGSFPTLQIFEVSA